MKTILEWANELPEDVREAFVGNTPKRRLSDMKESLYRAILAAFVWEHSTEGGSYWDSVHDWSKTQTGTCPPLPKTTKE